MAKYSVTDVLVSDANPDETDFPWLENGTPFAAANCFARIIENIEDPTKETDFPEYDTRTVRIVIEVTY